MACTGVLVCAAHSDALYNKLPTRTSSLSSTAFSCTTTANANAPEQQHTSTAATTQKFSYSRASPSVRWPNLKLTADAPLPSQRREDIQISDSAEEEETEDAAAASPDPSPRRFPRKKMTKLQLLRDREWRERVQYLTDRILGLDAGEFVADVLDDRRVQMTPTDFCFVVKWVGRSSWTRALEVYEWLNLRHWYSPSARMLAAILSVLGKANQESLAVEIFARTEPGTEHTVQVYNAMMGVYARNGRFKKVHEVLHLMRTRGCEPDLVSFNTLINARMKSDNPKVPNSSMELLTEVRRSGLKPDIITYNTLISACSREPDVEEAEKVYSDMKAHGVVADLWTCNAMISVYGRCGLSRKAELLFRELEERGFTPDAVSYNSLLYAFAREGNIQKVRKIREEMAEMGFDKDEMTYNTIIHMYGKQGHHDVALQLYKEMKLSGLNPDSVTYAVLIDFLGKANKVAEAADMMLEMLDTGVKPTLQAFSALLCGYAKAGKVEEAEKTFDCMLRSGIRPDHLAYSLMLDTLLRFNEVNKAIVLYTGMVRDGFTPDTGLYQVLLRVLASENKEEDVVKVVEDMRQLCGLNPLIIVSILMKCDCYDHAAKILKLAIRQGVLLDHKTLLSILNTYSSSARLAETMDLLGFLREHAPGHHQLVTEASIIILCKTHQLGAALEEYRTWGPSGFIKGGCTMYESLIHCCEDNELYADASQVFSDMNFYGIEPSLNIYNRMACIYCKMAFPETAHYLLNEARGRAVLTGNIPSHIYVDLVEAYGKLKLWEKAESLVLSIRQSYKNLDLKVWNALLRAYAASGRYEQARAVFNTMMKDGPSPTVDSTNSLLQALTVDGRLDELYVVIQELQDMGFKISKSSILLILDAFIDAGNIFEVKKVYRGMKAAGYIPTMHYYRAMIELLSRGKQVTEVESMVAEMEEMGLKPDLSVWNAMLKMYTKIDDFKKAVQVSDQIEKSGLKLDEDTYNTLLLMYCRDLKPEMGLSLMHEMRGLGMDPKLDMYKSLISACGKQKLWKQAEELFEDLLSKGHKLDRSFYHVMLKMYRNSGSYCKAKNIVAIMKGKGVEPTIATMHMLMVSYGASGQPQEAEKVLSDLQEAGSISTLSYSSVIDAYLKKGDYSIGIQKLMEMQKYGLEPDHHVWTYFIRAASLCQCSSEAIMLLNALREAGFDLPIRLLTEKSGSLILEVDRYLEKLESVEDNAAFNFVNSLGDLLWAFEFRSTAVWIFQLAIKRSIYRHDVFRVADKDWGADFRKLSAGSALVGLTLWLDHMQDASLQGSPESPKSIVLITGTAEYNMVSLSSTLKAFLWEMGSPFLPCKTRNGVLVAKGHSLRMWLKESPFCFDLELKDVPSLPELNSIQIIEGCFMRRGLVPAFKDITERLGQVRPKKFARLALLSDAKRDHSIRADVEGAKEKLEKRNKRTGLTSTGKNVKLWNKRTGLTSTGKNVKLGNKRAGLTSTGKNVKLGRTKYISKATLKP